MRELRFFYPVFISHSARYSVEYVRSYAGATRIFHRVVFALRIRDFSPRSRRVISPVLRSAARIFRRVVFERKSPGFTPQACVRSYAAVTLRGA